MLRRLLPVVALAWLIVASPAASGAWVLDLADEVRVGAGNVRVADLVHGAVPERAGEVVILGGARPGVEVDIDRRTILRRLVMAGAADGVSLGGASSCRVTVSGRAVAHGDLERRIRDLLRPHLPAAPVGAPASWVEVMVPATTVVTDGAWSVAWPEPATLAPGRNLISVQLITPQGARRLSVAAEVHAFARTPQVVGPMTRGQALEADMFGWAWTDLSSVSGEAITDTLALSGMTLGRDVRAGQPLLRRDLEPTPLVRRGEQVDLVVQRGRVAAVVRAECRQDGRRGEMVSVLNPLTKRLVLAHVAAPGVVTMGR